MLAKDLKDLTGLGGLSSGDCDRRGTVQQSFAAAIASTSSLAESIEDKKCGFKSNVTGE